MYIYLILFIVIVENLINQENQYFIFYCYSQEVLINALIDIFLNNRLILFNYNKMIEFLFDKMYNLE